MSFSDNVTQDPLSIDIDLLATELAQAIGQDMQRTIEILEHSITVIDAILEASEAKKAVPLPEVM